MHSLSHHMTIIYVLVADFLDNNPSVANFRRSNNSHPIFTDAEVITIALMQCYFQTPTLKRTYLLVRANDPTAFPNLPAYQQWLARLHSLSPQIGAFLVATCVTNASEKPLYIIDSKPIPLCHPLRHGRVRLMREEGSHFGKTKKGWFFGFKLHLVRERQGRILNVILTPGNWDDRDAALAMFSNLPSAIAIGDLGYRGPSVKELLIEEASILLITRADVAEKRELISTIRQGIETTFSQQWQNFIDRVYSRSWKGLWNTIMLKLINHQLNQAGVFAS